MQEIDETRELCFKINFKCDNDEFRPDPAYGIIGVLERIVAKLKNDPETLYIGHTQTILTDSNGYSIGGMKLFYKDNE